jgi:hypothetical protein
MALMQEQAMALETAASMTAPEGAIWQAWLDAFIHPKFETYARWYLRMNAHWRRISLAVSLPLALIAILVVIAHDTMYVGNSVRALTLGRFLNYLGSPHGLFELFDLIAAALVAIVAIPAIAVVFAHRSIGRYRIRFYIAYCTFMQTLPMACVFLVLGAVGYFVFSVFNFDSTAFMGQVAGFLFVYLPPNIAFGLISTGLAAATLRFQLFMYWMLIVIYIAIVLLVWQLLGHFLVALGFPVL